MHKMVTYVLGIGILLSGLLFATPTTKVLLTDPDNNRVIEVDGTGTLWWEYGSPTLNSPQEAIALTNGNILIADTGKDRIVEVKPDKSFTELKILSGSNFATFTPVDVRRCVNWLGGPYYGTDTLLIVDSYKNRVIECTYPGGNVIWEYSNPDLPNLREAEKRPGSGTPTYLIVNQVEGNRCIVVERTGPSSGDIKWAYSTSASDASWTPCGNVLIVESNRVIEVEYTTEKIVGTITFGFTTKEAIRMANGNILVAGYVYGTPFGTAIVSEIKGSQSTWKEEWKYETITTGGQGFVDVELKGIMNVAKIEYANIDGQNTQTTLCGIIVPILQPKIDNPFIIATKTVSPMREVSPGEILTYTINYENTGPGTATNVTIIDQIPEGTVYDSSELGSATSVAFSDQYPYDWKPSPTPPVTYIKWTINTIGPNVTGTVGFKVKVKE